MDEKMKILKKQLDIIISRVPIEKKLSRAKTINHIDGNSEIRTYYQTIVIKNKPRKSEYVKLKRICIDIIKSSDDIEIFKIANKIYNLYLKT